MKHLFLLTTLLVIPLTGALAVEITDRSYLSYLHFLQGIIYAKQGEISKAEYELKKTIEIDKNAVTAHKELMLVYIQQGKLGEANNLALELAKLTQDTKTSLFLGSYYVVTGDTENAILHYENAYSSQKDNLEAISALAGIYSLIAPDKALKYFDEYAKLKPDSIEILYRKALVLVKLKKPDEAKQNLIDAIEKDPSDILLYITLAEIYESQKDFLAAAQSVERAIEKEPDNFTLQISAGSYYFFAKDLSKAEKIFMSVLKKTPNEPTALYWLSLISEERKDWEMAKYYLSFIKDDKKYPDIGKYLRMSYY
ncbi:MAG: tetratricopeptide repeat protein, partial [Elusimicrobiota bacterium]